MDIQGDAGESAESKEESWRESSRPRREGVNNHEQNVGRNTEVNSHSDKVSDGMRNRLLEAGGKETLVICGKELVWIVFYVL